MKRSSGATQCRNCGSIRRKLKARDYCTKCYALVQKIDGATKWDIKDQSTLKAYPSILMRMGPIELEKVKLGFIRLLRERLGWLRNREEELKGQIDGLALQFIFNRLAQRCGVKNKSMFNGYTAVFDNCFDQKQKNLLFYLLDRIEQDIPWRINLNNIFLGK